MKKIFIPIFLVITLLILFSPTVLGDQSYHTERLPLFLTDEGALSGHILRNGQVVNIHPNGPVNGAIEVYVLNGAKPETEYQVWWDVQGIGELPTNLGSDPSPLIVQTDKKGNGRYIYHISRQWQEDMGFVDVDVIVRWIFKANGVNAFVTDWTQVHID